MANKQIFASSKGTIQPATDTVNKAGGKAYSYPPKHLLAQVSVTGFFGDSYYSKAEEQYAEVKNLLESDKIEPEFVAKTAIYSRQKGYMKDMSAFLLAYLAKKDSALLEKVFDRVVDDMKMLRNFAQILRSGAVGRKSFGTRIKRLIVKTLNSYTDNNLFKNSIGQDPSLADLIKMVHPKPTTETRNALYAYLLGKKHDVKNLPSLVQEFEAFKKGDMKEIPNISFQMLSSLNLTTEQWEQIALNATWTTVRMNLNTFERHGVLNNKEVVKHIVKTLKDDKLIAKSKVFPYQLLAAYRNVSDSMPSVITEALQDAMEAAVQNVPVYDGDVYVFPDVSGSMSSIVTGNRGSSSSKMSYIDVAALVSAVFLRKNSGTTVIPFEGHVVSVKLNGKDSIVTNAEKLASIGGGSTNCSAPLQLLNQQRVRGQKALLVYVSDSASWVDNDSSYLTETVRQWNEFKERNPGSKMVCIDIASYGTTQVKEHKDILNIGGFSDNIFETINLFINDKLNADHWVGEIEKIKI